MTILEFKRRQAGLSQAEIARQLGITSSSVSQIEGLYRKPWPKIRRQLSQLLGMSENELFRENGWPRELTVA